MPSTMPKIVIGKLVIPVEPSKNKIGDLQRPMATRLPSQFSRTTQGYKILSNVVHFC